MPKGKVDKYAWTSKVYEGTVRGYWVYVPAQYKADGSPARVMVFQDDSGMQSPTGLCRAPIVFDNLIHVGELPPIVGIFINPVTFPTRTRTDRAARIGVSITTR